MKKTVSILGCILFVLFFLFPFGQLFLSLLGYTVEITACSFYSVFSAIATLLSIIAVIMSIMLKQAVENKFLHILFSLLTPFSLITCTCNIIESKSFFVTVCSVICVLCCCFLTLKYAKYLTLKIIVFVLSFLMLKPIVFICCIALVIGDFGLNTIVMSLDSPDKSYYSEVVSSDQGALGGNTFVYVYENKSITTPIFKIYKNPKSVYCGKYREYETMEIYWKNDNCLVINSVEYTFSTK